MAFRLVKKETKYLHTKDEVIELATLLQSFGKTESEREIREIRMKRIQDKIKSTEMRPFGWAIGTVPATADTPQITNGVNGNHSSTVFLHMTEEDWTHVRFPVIIDWEEYECDTKQDLAILFEQFDPKWSGRDTTDLARAHLGQAEHLRGYPPKLATRISAGLEWYVREVNKVPKILNMQFHFFHENHDIQAFFAWAKTILNDKVVTRLHAPYVIAAIYHTTRSDQLASRREAALLFWREVSKSYQHLEEEMPAYKVDLFLENCRDPRYEWPHAAQRQFKGNQHRPKDADIFVSCLRAVSRVTKNQTLGEVYVSAQGRTLAQWIAQLYPLNGQA